MIRRSVWYFSSFFILISCSEPVSNSTSLDALSWIDLTYSFNDSTLYWPNNPTGFEKSTDAEGITDLGYFYSSYTIATPEHGGTHLDAPIHFAANGLTVDQIPLSSVTGQSVVVDVSEKALNNRDYLITVNDMENWEKKYGKLPAHQIVLFCTGYGKFYPNRKAYFGTEKLGEEALSEMHFPGIDPATAQWLVDKREVKAVGLDTPSLDYGQSKDFKTHQILMGADVPGFENVANLELLPPTGSYVVALPMKIGKGSGAPLRIIAGVQKP